MLFKDEIKESAINLAQLLSEKKGKEILALDVEKLTPLMDFIIIATAESSLHLNALTRYLGERLVELKIKPKHHITVQSDTPWVLIDCGTIVIHLFSKEGREFYRLEKLWNEAEVVFEEKLSLSISS